MEESIRNQAFCEPKYSVEEVAALVEEMLSKSYDMAKARTATLIEVLCPERIEKSAGRLNRETANLLGVLLADMKDAMLAVVNRKAPEAASLVAKEPTVISGGLRYRGDELAREAVGTISDVIKRQPTR